MLPELESVKRLQSLDLRIADLQKDIATLPAHLAKIEKALESLTRRLEADRTALVANQKERKKLEGDIQVQEQKISKLRGQTTEAKNNEQYRAFQSEIQFCEKEIRKCEDRILELMTQSEPLDSNVKQAEEALKIEKQTVEVEKNTVKDRTAKDEGFLAEAQSQRQQILSEMNPKLVVLYERIRKKWRGGAVIADASAGRCTGCHIMLRPQFFQDLKIGSEVLQCESCGRIVYYNVPVSFEADLQAPKRR